MSSSVAMWMRRLRLFLFRERASRELEEEMRLHRELRAEALRGPGASEADARVAASRRFGNATRIGETSRDQWGFAAIEWLGQDIRYAARRLRQRPGFSLAVIGVLALGIGASTAMFSAVDAAMLRPLPFHNPGQLVTLPMVQVPFDAGPGQPSEQRFANHSVDINDVAALHGAFSHTAAWASGGLNLSDPDHPRRITAGVVTADFFNTLGVPARIGRTFTADEGAPGHGRVVVLSWELWQGQYGGRAMLERTILLNGKPFTVIGVMPRGYSFPQMSDIWIPMSVPSTFETFEPFRGFLFSQVIARVAPGVSVANAASQLLAKWQLGIARDSASAAETNLPENVATLRRTGTAFPLQQTLVGDRRKGLLILLGATGILLLIACVNVTNLLLSQAVARRREMAVRETLGASRGRVVRQLLTESTLLSLGGALLGVALAPISLGLLRSLVPDALAGVAPARIDLRVLGFGAVLGMVCGIAFGLWPAIRSSSTSLGETIKSGGGHGGSARGANGGRRVLVGVELALTVVLLVGAGLMLRSFRQLLRLDGEIGSPNVGTLEMSFPSATNAQQSRLRVVNDILGRLAATPGITAAGVVNTLPLSFGGGILLSIVPDGMPPLPKDDERPGPLQLYASAGYFEAMGIPLLAGRTFTPDDDSLASQVAVINQRMATMYWPRVNALGRTFHEGSGVVKVIGIVRDIHEMHLDAEPMPQMYRSVYRTVPSTIALVARGALAPNAVLAAMQTSVRASDPSQAIFHLRTMDVVRSSSLAPRRTNTVLISLFATLALVLASLGVYAVVAHGVAQRSRELGIRAALGATSGNLIGLVAGEMGTTVVVGIGAGLAGAWMLSRMAATLLYGVTIHDPATYLVVPMVLAVVAGLATVIPGRRAGQVNPAEIIRND
ncbi:MAG TPA: ABC transporter permease [Gemmatimonadales bacterium]